MAWGGRRIVRIAAVVLAGGLLAGLQGCGTVSKADCEAGDWETIGLRDGRAGEPESLFASHAESCARYELPADKDGWMRGRERGLGEYCTPLSGFANGSAGREYQNVCTGAAAGSFLDAYGIGRDVGMARAEARRAREEVDRVTSRLRETDDGIADAERDATSEDPQRRKVARDRLRELHDLRFGLMRDLYAAERALPAAENAADVAEARGRDAFRRRFGYPPG